MSVVPVTPAAGLPLTLAEIKDHLRIEHEFIAQDALLYALIRAAARHVETTTGRALISQGWRLTRSSFADGIELPRPPAIAISSITYLDVNNVEQTLSSAVYELEDAGATFAPGRVRLAHGQSWPAVLARHDAVRINFTAGYGADLNDFREKAADLRLGILMLIDHWYSNPGAVQVGTAAHEVPLTVDALLASYRMPGF